jgi:hypothetical protein
MDEGSFLRTNAASRKSFVAAVDAPEMAGLMARETADEEAELPDLPGKPRLVEGRAIFAVRVGLCAATRGPDWTDAFAAGETPATGLVGLGIDMWLSDRAMAAPIVPNPAPHAIALPPGGTRFEALGENRLQILRLCAAERSASKIATPIL